MRGRPLLLIAVAAFALAGPVPTALAARFTVNNPADEPDSKPGDGLCLTAAADCTLRAAVQEANELGGGPHTIALAAGVVYTLTRLGSGEDAASTGDLDIAANVIVTVPGGHAVVEGRSGWDDRIFHVLAGVTTEFNGLDIRHGAIAAGAGIFSNADRLTVTTSTVSGNYASAGGGIYNFGGGTLTVTNSTVSGNSAGYGGGIYNFGGGTVTVTNSTVSGNTASGDGGGIVNGSGTLTLTNSTVSGNYAFVHGGIRNDGTMTANNVTIARNAANSGAGGIFVYSGTVSLANTIVATNVDTGAATESPDCVGALTSRGYNLIQNTTGCTIGGDTTSNITGRDPQLGPLQDNGGATFTHALMSVATKLGGFAIPSPAIDAGNPSRGPLGILCASSDQRGVNRTDGNADGFVRCDIGAYEYVPPPFALGSFALAPAEATVRPGELLTYELTWTVPSPRGWRSLRTLELAFLDDEGTALWVRFEEVAAAPGLFGLVNPNNGNAGPAFAPGSPNPLESNVAAIFLAETSVDGPPGRRVTLTLTLSFKPHAADHSYDVLVGATDDAGEVQGFHRAGTVALTR